jgi:hypothetical protein
MKRTGEIGSTKALKENEDGARFMIQSRGN